jgi:hypothetical protein
VGALQLEEQNSKHINHNNMRIRKEMVNQNKGKMQLEGKRGSTRVIGSIVRAYGATIHGVQLKTYMTYLSQFKREAYINA